jgi:hypothetical protein
VVVVSSCALGHFAMHDKIVSVELADRVTPRSARETGDSFGPAKQRRKKD